jgi:hypothetical protein
MREFTPNQPSYRLQIAIEGGKCKGKNDIKFLRCPP